MNAHCAKVDSRTGRLRPNVDWKRILLRTCWICALCSASGLVQSLQAQDSSAPALVHKGEQTQLIVDGRPFIMLGGEAGNSSGSNPEDMEAVYRALDAIHANTAEMPLSWNLIEPEPGKYDFHLLDAAVGGARRHQLKLVFLWFGSTKNATLSYVPDWIKRDRKTYFRIRNSRGQELAALSPFCDAALRLDERAFAAIMQHIRDIDQHDHTVIMMQVENETGLPGTDRDYSPQATESFEGPVAENVMKYLERNRNSLTPELQSAWKAAGFAVKGSWQTVFGDLAEEAFSAWVVSRYVDSVAAQGKSVYNIPNYINVALRNTGAARPGDWPSGGAVSDVIDIWKATATHIDIIAPDIYRTDFPHVASPYNRADNVLFIPETGFAPYYAPYVFTALAGMNAIGFSPFGIDQSLNNGALTESGKAVEENYRILAPLLPVIAKHRYSGKMFPFVAEMYRHEALAIPLGDALAAVVHFDEPFAADVAAPRAGGMIIKLSSDTYIVTGQGVTVHFRELKGPDREPEFLSIEEGTFEGDTWRAKRSLNGDEERLVLGSHKPRILRVRLNRGGQ